MTLPPIQVPLEFACCRYGYMIYDPTDRGPGQALHTFGEYNESEVDVFKVALAGGGSAIDVGAYIGDHTLALAELAERVVAFEPNPFRALLARANLAMNKITNVELVESPCGTGDGLTVAIDSLPLREVKLIKVDVDGPEVGVLKGARTTIARWKPWLYVEADRPENVEEIISTIRGMGYTPFWHLATHWNEDNFREETIPGEAANIVSIMLLAVPEASTVRGLREARPGDGQAVRRGPNGTVEVSLGDLDE